MNVDVLSNIWWILSAHFIGDWALQNRWMADNKGKYWEILFAHCFIYTASLTIAFQYLNLFSLKFIPFIFISHFLIDKFSCYLYSKSKKEAMRYVLWIDHLCHFFVILGVIIWD
jgi:hypothetical protein